MVWNENRGKVLNGDRIDDKVFYEEFWVLTGLMIVFDEEFVW